MLSLLPVALALAVAADPVTEPPKPKKERKICRSLDTTGSRMGKPPVCKTAAEWEAEAELARRTMEFRQRREGL